MVRVDWHGSGGGGADGITAGTVMVITLDRPQRRNAVDYDTLVQLHQAQASAGNTPARAVVLTGTPPAFCAGADLGGVEDRQFTDLLLAVLYGFTELPMPVVGAIDGAALGAGTQLAAVCDLRVVTPRSTFGIPAARLGLAVDEWTVHRLNEQFTPAVTRAMLLAAETFDGERLHAVGAVHRLGGFDDALVWASEIAGLAPLSIAAHKLTIERISPAPKPEPDVVAARDEAWASSDANEGRAAFHDKRPPRFTGR